MRRPHTHTRSRSPSCPRAGGLRRDVLRRPLLSTSIDTSAPAGWHRVVDTPSGSVPWGRFAHPFVFRTTAAALRLGVVQLCGHASRAGSELSCTVVPQSRTLGRIAPRGLQPARRTLPGTIVNQHWQATFVAIPPRALTWRASFPKGKEGLLGRRRGGSHRYPGGAGWQSPPTRLPQEHAVWSLTVAWALAPGLIARVPPLR